MEPFGSSKAIALFFLGSTLTVLTLIAPFLEFLIDKNKQAEYILEILCKRGLIDLFSYSYFTKVQ